MSKWKPPAKPVPKPVEVKQPEPIEEVIAGPEGVPNDQLPALTLAEPSDVATLVEEVKAPVPLMASVEPAKPPTYRHVDGDRNVQTLSREAAIKLLADRLKIRGEAAEGLLNILPKAEIPIMVPATIAGSRAGTLELS